MSSRSPDVFELIFSEPVTVWSVRIVVIAVAAVALLFLAFVALSISGRMRRGDLLTRFGPFEIADREAQQAVLEERDRLRDELATARAGLERASRRVRDMERRLSGLDDLLGRSGNGDPGSGS